MTTKAPPRPHKVSVACLMAGMGSVLVLVSVFAELQNWGSLELREQVRDALAGSPFDGQVEVAQVLDWLRLVLMAVAAGAAAGVIAAIWTAKGHHGARILLTLLAGGASLGFLATGLLGVLPAAMTVWCIVYLWSKQARAWFAGEEPPPERPAESRAGWPQSGPPQSGPPQSGPESGQGSVEAPPATPAAAPEADSAADSAPGWGSTSTEGPRPSDRPFGTPAQQSAQQPAQQAAHPPQSGGVPPGPYGLRRPRSIVIAVVVTSVMAGLVAMVCGANAMLYLLSPSEYTRLLLDQPMLQEQQILDQLGVSGEELAQMVFIGATVCAVLAAAAIGTALLLLRRLRAARIGLTILTGLAIALSVVAFPLGLIWAVGEVFVLVQLYRVDANAWLAAPH